MVKITSLQSRVLDFIVKNIQSQGAPPTLREIAHHFEWKAVGSAQDVIASLRKKGYLEPAAAGRARQTIPTSEAYQHLGLVPQHGPGSASQQGDMRRRQPQVQTLWDVTETENSPTDINGLPTDSEPQGVVVPLLGSVQAGHPQEAIEQPDAYVTLPPHPRMRTEKHFFAVEVEGYSMVNAGMLPGDLLLIESEESPKNGEIVLAVVGNSQEATVKRFALKGSQHYRGAIEKTELIREAKEKWPPALLVPENEDFEAIAFGQSEGDRVLGLVRSLFRGEVN